VRKMREIHAADDDLSSGARGGNRTHTPCGTRF
jgi:hypothetical protein